jgi:hypothetical protein
MEIRVGLALDSIPFRVAGRSSKGKQMKLKPANLFAHGCKTTIKTNPLRANS